MYTRTQRQDNMASPENKPPMDPTYPRTRPAVFSPRRKVFIVHPGDYVVNGEGLIMIVTTSNDGPYPNDFIRGLTKSYYRAKYIGNADDGLYAINWSRPANAQEIIRAKQYVPQGQMALF